MRAGGISGDASPGDQLFKLSTGVLHRLPLLVLHVLDLLLLIELIFLFFIAISDALRFTMGIAFCFVPSGYGHCKETLDRITKLRGNWENQKYTGSPTDAKETAHCKRVLVVTEIYIAFNCFDANKSAL